MDAETTGTRFRPGISGNPNGRPRGSGIVREAREQLERAWNGDADDGSDGIRAKLIEQAKAGDMLAIKLVAERVCPALKPADPTATIELEGLTLTEKTLGVLTALAAGAAPLPQAKQLLDGLAVLAKIVETDELKQRIEALEKGLREREHGQV